MTLTALRAYLAACREHLATEEIDCLVLGHPAPDGDAVVSALCEAWRRHLISGQWAVPVVQAAVLPREVAYLLGDTAPLLPTEEALAAHADTPVVLTDHHTDPARQHQVVAVVDHHRVSPHTDLVGIDAHIRPVGATTTLVVLASRQAGLIPDEAVARILLGAILLDTDGLSPHKAKAEDVEAAGWLTSLCGAQPTALYADLREHLLAETDPATLYNRDYRLYTDPTGVPVLGFAILKVWANALPDRGQVRRLLAEDVARRGCRACVAKITLYDRAGITGEHYLTAGEPTDTEAVLAVVMAAAGSTARRIAPDEVFLPAEAIHRGRKWLACEILQKVYKI